MRPLLDGLYRLSGCLAAVSVAGIAALVCGQVALNVADALMNAVLGRSLGASIPSYAELAGYLLASASFLALAPTWRSGGHIRVTLVLDRLDRRLRRRIEIGAVGAVAGVTAFLTYYTGALGIESWRYGDVSPGLVPVPLWWPQSIMALGLMILLVAQLDSLIELLAERRERLTNGPAADVARRPAPAGG